MGAGSHLTSILTGVLLVHVRYFSGSGLKAGCRVGYMHDVHLVPCILAEEAAENLLEALAEVLGHEGVDDRVEAGVGISHAVGEQSEGIGGLVEGKITIQVA